MQFFDLLFSCDHTGTKNSNAFPRRRGGSASSSKALNCRRSSVVHLAARRRLVLVESNLIRSLTATVEGHVRQPSGSGKRN